MASAVEIIGTKGYEATCVDDIVEQAGRTRGAFYYYFANKAEVARDAQETLWSDAGNRAPKLVDPEADFLTRTRRSLEIYLAALKNLGPEGAFLRQGFDEPTLGMFDDEGKKWGRHFVRAMLVDAMDRGEIPLQDLDGAISSLVEALQVLTLAALKGDDVTDALRVIDELNEALLRPDPLETSEDSDHDGVTSRG
ncbi:MAG TPA: helix-turn-helix domain-containing protein [Acidimicrobiales bacterium]|nr:helix-turn-helix domain-containing protein [Acidimicrobiales bacterium]